MCKEARNTCTRYVKYHQRTSHVGSKSNRHFLTIDVLVQHRVAQFLEAYETQTRQYTSSGEEGRQLRPSKKQCTQAAAAVAEAPVTGPATGVHTAQPSEPFLNMRPARNNLTQGRARAERARRAADVDARARTKLSSQQLGLLCSTLSASVSPSPPPPTHGPIPLST